ncbi:baseplate assembly protein J [Rhizobium phage RHph_I72]|nr:baseplate assembly protein J [Rhizobium phage RHph_I65]QIG76501.1 baseplate assembly protein J [Rhizobium phage RHph_I72]
MTEYGVQPTGFVRKSLSTILAEIEASMVTEFGPGVLQTADTPLGQINGLMSDLTASLWELAEDIYQSYDPAQAEGNRLDTLASIRLLGRQVGELDMEFRQAITNEGQARIDLQDVARAVAALDGVTYYHVWANDTGAMDENLMPASSVCVAVTGGDDDDIAAAIRRYLVPGVSLYGNTLVESEIDGFCRSLRILRPIEIPVSLTITVRKTRDGSGCPPPSNDAVKAYFLSKVALLNGADVSHYAIRNIIENGFSNVEVVSFVGERDSIVSPMNQAISIGFIERAVFNSDNVTVVSE